MRFHTIMEDIKKVWYHGTPELQKFEKFEGRSKFVSYIVDPDAWDALQTRMSEVEHGSSEYFELLDKAAELKQNKEIKSPIFFSDKRAVAATYADDARAFDYQNAEPGIITAEIDDGKNLKIHVSYGSNFRGISKASVISALKKAGIADQEIDQALRSFAHHIRGNGNKISTDDLVAITDHFNFDTIDVHGVVDDYMAKGPASTVRMVLNPALIKVK